MSTTRRLMLNENDDMKKYIFIDTTMISRDSQGSSTNYYYDPVEFLNYLKNNNYIQQDEDFYNMMVYDDIESMIDMPIIVLYNTNSYSMGYYVIDPGKRLYASGDKWHYYRRSEYPDTFGYDTYVRIDPNGYGFGFTNKILVKVALPKNEE